VPALLHRDAEVAVEQPEHVVAVQRRARPSPDSTLKATSVHPLLYHNVGVEHRSRD
jgi:hypothetical protein